MDIIIMPKTSNQNMLFELTPQQYMALRPLFDKIDNAFMEDSSKKGVIILQPQRLTESIAIVTGRFVPYKYAKRIIKILEELKKDAENA